MRNCLARNIRDRWYKRAAALLMACAPAWAAGDLASLVQAYRTAQTPAKKAAIQSYAVTHPKEAPAARLALGIAAFEQKDYAAAIADLRRANIPQLADYAAYYLAAARVESKDTEGVAKDLAPTHTGELRSPLAARAWLVEAKALGPA